MSVVSDLANKLSQAMLAMETRMERLEVEKDIAAKQLAVMATKADIAVARLAAADAWVSYEVTDAGPGGWPVTGSRSRTAPALRPPPTG